MRKIKTSSEVQTGRQILRYLIDGYNLFFKLQKEILPLQKKREGFIEALDRKMTAANLSAMIIFDSDQENSLFFASKRKLQSLEIIFSPKNLSADEYILELLTWNSRGIILITSDKELSIKASSLGAKIKTVETFIALLLKKKKQRFNAEEKKNLYESEANLRRLLLIFEKKFKEDKTDE